MTWHDALHVPDAACVAHIKAGGADLWFPAENSRARAPLVEQAHEICKSCPHSHVCAAYADARREQYGVWGGIDREVGRKASDRVNNARRSATQRKAMERVWRERGVTIPTPPPAASQPTPAGVGLGNVIAMPTRRTTLPPARRGRQPQHGNESCWRRGCRCDACTTWHDGQRRTRAAEAYA